jgi:hypothetical protein
MNPLNISSDSGLTLAKIVCFATYATSPLNCKEQNKSVMFWFAQC